MLRAMAALCFFALSLPFIAVAGTPLPAQCRAENLPRANDPVAVSQENVRALMAILEDEERSAAWSQRSAWPFRQSMDLCGDKWSAIAGPGGQVNPNMVNRCMTLLICSRLNVLSAVPGQAN